MTARADRYLLSVTKQTRDAQLSRESKERVRKFRQRNHNRRIAPQVRLLKETA